MARLGHLDLVLAAASLRPAVFLQQLDCLLLAECPLHRLADRSLPRGGNVSISDVVRRRWASRGPVRHPNSRFQLESAGFGLRPERPLKPLWQAENRLPEAKAPTGIEPV